MSVRKNLSLSIVGALAAATTACATKTSSPEVEEHALATTSAAVTAQCGADAVVDAAQRISSPVLIARRPGVLDLLYSGSATAGAAFGSVRHRVLDTTQGGGAWSAEEDLGGNISKPGGGARDFFFSLKNPSMPQDAFELLGMGPDGTLQHRTWIPGGGAWDAAGGGINFPNGSTITKSPVALSSWAASRADAFYTGADGTLQHRAYNTGRHLTGWSLAESLGAKLTGAPAAISWEGTQRIDVFGRNAADNQLWHVKYVDGWGTPELLGGNLASDPTVASWGAGRLDVFWADADGALKHNAFDNSILTTGMPESKGWLGEEAMGGGAIEGNPTAASWGGHRIDLIVEAKGTHQLKHRTWFGNTTWTLTSCAASGANPSGSTCDYGLVAWNLDTAIAQTCSGGSEYQVFNAGCPHFHNASGTANGCPEADITHLDSPNSCNWATTYHNEHRQVQITGHDVTVRKCGMKGCWFETTWVWNDNRTHAMQAVVDSYKAAFYNHYGDNVTAANNVLTNVSPTLQTVDFDLSQVPDMHVNAPSAAHCGTTPVPPTPWWPACTTTADDHSCGTTVQHGAFDTPLPSAATTGDLDTSHNDCLTDENHPIDNSTGTTTTTQADAQNKYTRLQTNLARANANQIAGVDNALLAQRIVKELKLLFETYGAQLLPAQQEASAKLYFDLPDTNDTPACGETFVPPDTTSCTDTTTTATINTALAFCARMSSAHVSPAVRYLDAVKYRCIDVGGTIAKLRAPFIAAGGTDDGSASALAPVGTVTPPILPPMGEARMATPSGVSALPKMPICPDIVGGCGPTVVPDSCGFKQYRAAYDTWVTTPLGARLNEPKDPRLPATAPELQTRLYLMDRWYRMVEAMYPHLAAEPPANASKLQQAAWTHAQNMEASMWRGIYRNLFPQTEVTAGATPAPGGTWSPTFTAGDLVALTHDTLLADHNLLMLMLTPYTGKAAPDVNTNPTPPLQTAPLLLLLADAFEGMQQRMKDVSIYHDMGCAYAGCVNGVDSEMVHLVKLLSDIADPGALQTESTVARNLKDASGQYLVRRDWLDVYDNMLTSHPALENALRDAMNGGSDWVYTDNEPLLENAGLPGIPDPARHLASVIQGMRTMAQTYKESGLFNPSARNHLAAGIQEDDIATIRGNIDKANGDLDKALTNYVNNLQGMASQVIQEMGLKKEAQQATDQMNQKYQHLHNISADIAGLTDSLEGSEKEFGRLAQSYSKVTAFDPGVLITGTTYGPFPLDGSSAKAPYGWRGGSYAAIAAQTIASPGAVASTSNVFPSNKGTIVTITVSPNDKWSPSCALQSARIPGPTSPGPFGIQATQPTGPEGYIVTYSNGTFSGTKNETAESQGSNSSKGVEAKICTGNDLTAGISLFGSGAQAYTDISACASTSGALTSSSSDSHGTNNGSQLTASANFASGMRLPMTPVPNAPVGALLAIVTAKGHPEKALEIHVVQSPATTIVLTEDADLQLVANDIATCSPDTQYHLSATVTTARHASDALKWVNDAMATVAKGIVDNGAAYVAQGVLLPEQEATIRSSAWTNLVKICKTEAADPTACDPSKLPQSVNNFIAAMIDRAIEGIALKVQILANGRLFDSVALDLQQNVDDYNASMEQGRVAELLPQWTLRNLDSELLRAESANLVHEVTYNLYPILELRYSPLLPVIQNDLVLGPAIMALVNAKWDASVQDLGNQAHAAAAELSTKTTSLEGYMQKVKPNPVALSFPRPGKITTTWMHADDARNDAVWQEATTGDHVATFRVLPEDLYRLNGVDTGLLCTEEVPVIRDFAIVIAGPGIPAQTGEDRVNKRFLGLRSTSAPTLTFAQAAILDANNNVFKAGGPIEFELAPDWQSLDTQVLASSDALNVLTRYTTLRGDRATNMNGRGLSPFTDFTVDFSLLYDPSIMGSGQSPLDQADQIVLVMVVESRQVSAARSMSWISTCQPAKP